MNEYRPVIYALLSALILIMAAMFVIPLYKVWANGLEGEAELRHAEWSRQIAVREAQAKRDAAVMLADAEIARARGVAQSNKIIGDSLKENEAYLRYLWIDGLQHTNNQIVYIPTEGNLPILESTRNIIPRIIKQ